MKAKFWPIFLVSILAFFLFHFSLRDIQGWPSDSSTYVDFARRINEMSKSGGGFLSYNSVRRLTLNEGANTFGKEALILATALSQRLLNDYEGLYPNILVNVLAFIGGSIVLYFIVLLISKCHWLAFLAFLIHLTSLWPYQSVIQGAHLILAEFFALSAILCAVLCNRQTKLKTQCGLYFLLGFLMTTAPFASTTAPIIAPAFLGIVIFLLVQHHQREQKAHYRPTLLRSGALLLGAFGVVLFFTGGNIDTYAKSFLSYVRMGISIGNPFLTNPESWGDAIPKGVVRGGGMLWLLKYFQLMMPVVFPMVLLSLGFHIVSMAGKIQKRSYKSAFARLVFVLVMLSPILSIEFIGMNQIGRTYFLAFPFLCLLVAMTVHEFLESRSTHLPRWALPVAGSTVLICQLLLNVPAIARDIHPARKVITYLTRDLEQLKGGNLYISKFDSQTPDMINYLNERIHARYKVYLIEDVCQVHDGYIIVPPISSKTSLYVDCVNTIRPDLKAEELITRSDVPGLIIKKYATLASSRYWVNEEPICTYRALMGELKPSDFEKGDAYLLDGSVIQSQTDLCGTYQYLRNPVLAPRPFIGFFRPDLVRQDYKGFNIIRFAEDYYAILQTDGNFSMDRVKKNDYVALYSAPTYEAVLDQIDRRPNNGVTTPNGLIRAGYKSFNLIGYKGKVYAIKQGEGEFSLQRFQDHDYSQVFVGEDEREVLTQIDRFARR